MRAVVLLSGGLDSATVLALARSEGRECFALSLDYSQRHGVELEAACRVAKAQNVSRHLVVQSGLGQFGGSALTDESIAVPDVSQEDIPATYVPARNMVLLSLGVSWAEILEAEELYIGANQIDYSGYPDCREQFLKAFERAAELGTRSGVNGRPVRICAPLLMLSKADIIRLGASLGVDYSLTVSCYKACRDCLACGVCDSCRIRAAGFARAGILDPIGGGSSVDS